MAHQRRLLAPVIAQVLACGLAAQALTGQAALPYAVTPFEPAVSNPIPGLSNGLGQSAYIAPRTGGTRIELPTTSDAEYSSIHNYIDPGVQTMYVDHGVTSAMDMFGRTDGRLVEMNARGDVIGEVWTTINHVGRPANTFSVLSDSSWTTGKDQHAFLYSQGTTTPILTPAGTYNWSQDLNSQGQVLIGSTLDTPVWQPSNSQAYVYDKGQLTGLGAGTFGSHINDRGQVLYNQWTERPDGALNQQALLYQDGQSVSLGDGSVAQLLNEAGQVAGVMVDGQHAQPFLYEGGVMTPIGSGGVGANITRLTAGGRVTGVIGNASGTVSRSFVYQDGKVTFLKGLGTEPNTPQADFFDVQDINDRGEVLGLGVTGVYTPVALLYRDGETMDLGAMIGQATGDGFTFDGGMLDLKEDGTILASGTTLQGLHLTYLLTPVPEPTSAALMALGLLGVLGLQRRQRTALIR